MKNTFIDSIKPGAIQAYKDVGILPSLTIAQAILETGWGKSAIGNNIFGIKADKSWKGKVQTVPTHEYINGKKVPTVARFRDYDSIEDSIRDRSKFLSSMRYQNVRAAESYRDGALEFFRAGYATDPQYSQKLIIIIEQNKLFLIDEEVKKKKEGVNDTMTENMNNKPSDWAKESWDWAVKNKLVDGSNPKSNITREQMATVLHRYSKLVK